MKKTQRKDVVRNIKAQKISFLSIVFVVALGVGIFLACGFSSEALSGRVSGFYRETAWHDLEVRSTNGITEEDVAAAGAIPGVKEAEGVFALDMLADCAGGMTQVHVVSETQDFDRCILLEGRAPEEASECAVVPELAEELHLSVGDEINLSGLTGDTFFLNRGTFRIAGIIRHPDHFRHELAATYNVLIRPEAVDTEKMGRPWTGMMLSVETAAGDAFSAEYQRDAAAAGALVTSLGKEREQAWYEEVRAEADERIAEGERKLAEGQAALDGLAVMIEELEGKLADPGLPLPERAGAGVLLQALTAGRSVGEAARADGLAQLEAGKKQAEALEPGTWIVMDRSLNLSWTEVREMRRIFAGFGRSFALLFVLLAVLVCYATIGRIVDEQRKLVGAMKALGFTEREIFLRYFSFGLSGGLLGVILGLALSYFVLEQMMMSTAEEVFLVGGIPKVFDPLSALVSALTALALAGLAAFGACRKLLKQPAVTLMSGEVPASFGRKKGRKGQKGSLYTNLIIRNMVSDWKRVMITVVIIAGSCILLVIGFSMKYSFGEVINRQFTDIIRYDAMVSLKPSAAEEDTERLLNLCGGAGAEAGQLASMGAIIGIGESEEAVQLICGEQDVLAKFVRLRDAAGGEDLAVPAEGIVVFNRFAEIYGLKEGDRMTVLDDKGRVHEAVIGGVYTAYAGRSMFMSAEYAAKLLGDGFHCNSVVLRFGDGGGAELTEQIMAEESFLGITLVSEMRKRYESMVRMMDLLVVSAIIIAAFMSAAVLLNLVRIQLNQKKREMTIMRVNGFTVRETVSYILRENVLTTAAGIAAGLLAGSFAAQFNLRTIDSLDMMLVKDLPPQPCLFAAVITLFFAFLVNFFSLRGVRNLSLADA